MSYVSLHNFLFPYIPGGNFILHFIFRDNVLDLSLILLLLPCTSVGGPDRPIPEKPELGSSSTEEGLASTAAEAAAGFVAGASAMHTNLYNRLSSAVNERGCVRIQAFSFVRRTVESIGNSLVISMSGLTRLRRAAGVWWLK